MQRQSRSASLAFAALLFLGGLTGFGQATTQPSTRPARVYIPDLPTDQAQPKYDNTGQIEGSFKAKHEAILARGRSGPIDLLFLGDSITEGWKWTNNLWQQYYAKDNPANFGIGGDRTQHVLWRIDQGELDGINPKVVVLMIGTNNIGSSAAEIAKGDEKIVARIHEKLPSAKLLILGIFPRGHDPKDPAVMMMRDKISQVNQDLAKLDGTPNTRYLDIGSKFLDADGILQPEVMKDFLHPTHKGYEIWAAAMQPTLDEMMK